MVINNQLRMYEVRTFLKQDNATGAAEERFYVVSGSRMLVTLKVLSADPGATVTLNVENTFDADAGFETIETMQVVGTGTVKRIFSDFNNLFKLSANVTGGNATYRVAVAVFDNAVTTKIENAQLDVSLDHTVDTLGHFDSVRIGDGQHILDVNEDGSINVRTDNADDETPVNPYDEALAVPSGAETTIVAYQVPAGNVGFLYRVEASGENIARYRVYVNGVAIATRRTYFGANLTTTFEFFTPNKRQVVLQAGDIVEIKVLHNRPSAGDFEARAQLLLKTV